MIGGDQLIHTVIRPPAPRLAPAIASISWKLIRPVHPVDSGIDVVFIACSNLQDICNPMVVDLVGLHRLVIAYSPLTLDARLVCNVEEASYRVLHPMHYRTKNAVS